LKAQGEKNIKESRGEGTASSHMSREVEHGNGRAKGGKGAGA
jgi:hypothetical protein